jgi:hypothetical protein
VPAGNPADAWPRHAVLVSLLIAAFGFVVALVGISLSADRAPAVVYATVLAAFGAQVGFSWLLRGFFDRWFEDRLDERAQARIVRIAAITALALVVLAVLPPTRPVGVAAIGGMTVGLMLANVSAVRRARRGG